VKYLTESIETAFVSGRSLVQCGAGDARASLKPARPRRRPLYGRYPIAALRSFSPSRTAVLHESPAGNAVARPGEAGQI